ncbi:MAG: phosphoribosylformylglycinamidine cyclo-ligase [Pseudomonadota bacterium]
MKIRSYKDAGVDVEAGNRLAKRIGELARKTHRPEVVSGVGGFAGLCSLPKGFSDPLLVSGTDGVGTKLKLAFEVGKHDTIGIDLVAMCVNDVLTVGALPLFFLDYFAVGHLDEEIAEQVISGIVEGCKQAGCTLLGGETAEMPGFYAVGEYDVAGFAVGVVERSELIDGSKARPGDKVIGLPSSGLHSNGYSLARQVLVEKDTDLNAHVEVLGRSLAEELLVPTRIYVSVVQRLLANVPVKALAHITGGGLVDNPPRVIPKGLGWRFFEERWTVPKVMELIAEKGQVPKDEMRRTFNMGLGMLAVIPAKSASVAKELLAEEGARVVGEIVDLSGTRDQSSVEFMP